MLQLVADVEAEEARVDAMSKEHDNCRTHLKANDAALHDATFKEHQFKRQIASIQERTQRMHKQHASRKEAAEEGMETATKEWEEVNAERAATEEQLHASELQLRAENEKVRARTGWRRPRAAVAAHDTLLARRAVCTSHWSAQTSRLAARALLTALPRARLACNPASCARRCSASAPSTSLRWRTSSSSAPDCSSR